MPSHKDTGNGPYGSEFIAIGVEILTGPRTQRDSQSAESDASALGLAALLWLGSESSARVIVDERLHVIWVNDAARIELQLKRDIEIRSKLLAMTDRAHQPGLEGFLLSCGGEIGTWSVPRADGNGHLLFRARKLNFEGRSWCGIAFHGSGTEFAARYADLDAIFGLTRAEHDVLTQMLDGHEAVPIARHSKVSIETTRSHIRAIYLKLDVSSRESLFRKLHPYRI